MKVALVYDRVNKWGGAERVLLALHQVWPEAPLYTAVYNRQSARWAHVFRVIPSFVQSFPFAKQHHEWYPWLTPMAFETFDFDGYDVVISVTSAEAKGVLTKPSTVHICYCLTPTRYLWSGVDIYQQQPLVGMAPAVSSGVFRTLLPTLRRWDLIAARRPDHYIAISGEVKHRIAAYYGQTADVIYPPVDVDQFVPKTEGNQGDYFLVVSRLVPYKRLDIVIDAFNRLGWPLTIVGTGVALQQLKNRANTNIRFVTEHLTESELRDYYQNCRAFVFAGVEDFGIVGVEALACGKPVIAYKAGGMAEIVEDGKSGVLFTHQSVEALTDALQRFASGWYDSRLCRKRAQLFGVSRFKKQMQQSVEHLYKRSIHI